MSHKEEKVASKDDIPCVPAEEVWWFLPWFPMMPGFDYAAIRDLIERSDDWINGMDPCIEVLVSVGVTNYAKFAEEYPKSFRWLCGILERGGYTIADEGFSFVQHFLYEPAVAPQIFRAIGKYARRINFEMVDEFDVIHYAFQKPELWPAIAAAFTELPWSRNPGFDWWALLNEAMERGANCVRDAIIWQWISFHQV
jgi:hypothetical protein